MYYSQSEEDRILNEGIFHDKKGGVFVDIGAYDGVSFSNTYYFESSLDWTGLCVEPLKGPFSKLVESRPGSICVQGCVYDREGNCMTSRWFFLNPTY